MTGGSNQWPRKKSRAGARTELWRWEARMPDPTRSGGTTRSNARSARSRKRRTGSPTNARAAPRHVHRRAPSRASVQRSCSTPGRSPGRTASPDDRTPLPVDHRQVPHPRVRPRPDRQDHARAHPALHQPALAPTTTITRRDGAERLRRPPHRLREGRSPRDAAREPLRRRSTFLAHNGEEMLFLTADEVRAVAEAIDPHYRVLVYTAAYTGLRAGELAGLQRAGRRSPARRHPRSPRAEGRERAARTRPDEDARAAHRLPADVPQEMLRNT